MMDKRFYFSVRKIMICIFVIVLMTFVVDMAAKAEVNLENGTVTDDEGRSTSWEFNMDTKELTISGDGQMAYCAQAEDWRQYYKITKKIIITDGIKTVSVDAFSNFYQCNEVILADSVTKIEYQAFCGCSALNKIKWPASLEIIEASAFSNAFQDFCNGYKDMAIVFPSGLKTIEDFAFNYCNAVKVYKFPVSLTNLQGSSVFQMNSDDMTICCSTDAQISYCKKYELKYMDSNQKVELEKSKIKIKNTDYTGEEVHPDIYYNNIMLVEGIDYDAVYENNINIGKAVMELTGKGVYSGIIKTDFKVTKIQLDNNYPFTVNLCVDGKIYDGISYEAGIGGLDFEPKEHECSIDSIFYKGKELIKEKDYEEKIEMIDSIAGSFRLEIKGINGYSGVINKYYQCFKMPQLAQCEVEMLSEKSVLYNFEDQKPEFKVTYYGFEFPKERYDVFWEELQKPDMSVYNFVDPNKGKIGFRVSGLEGTEEFEYEIKAIDITQSEVSLSVYEYIYHGEEITPVPEVELDGRQLMKESDFKLTYENNQSGGTATVIIEGCGGYTGTIKKEFEIKTSVKLCTIELLGKNVVYSGEECKPEVVVKMGDVILKQGKDYTIEYFNNIDEGEAKISIVGVGEYADESWESFVISKLDIADGVISLEKPLYVYDGKEKKPSVTVKLNDDMLVKDKDYSVVYSDNIEEGMATATITGVGVYKGNVQLTYNIVKQDLSDGTITLDQTLYTYDGAAKKPVVKINYEDKTLREGLDYSINYINSDGVGTAGVKVIGKGLYKGELTAEYKINPISINDAIVNLKDTIFTYDGSAKRPSAEVVLNSKLLVEGTDYILSYRDNINEGTAYAIIDGIGIYSGNVEINFKILPYQSGMDAVYKEDDTLMDDDCIYHIIDVDDKEVEFTAPVDNKETDIVVPATIKTDNGDIFTVISIGEKAFYKNTKIKKLTIANTVKSIENYAFYGCKNLTTIKIGNGIEIVGDSAFRQCTKLTSITLPKSVDKLGKNCFYGCRKLKTITIKSNQVIDIQKNVIKGISKKCVIKVPKKLIKKYKKEFDNKSGFKKTMKIKKM